MEVQRQLRQLSDCLIQRPPQPVRSLLRFRALPVRSTPHSFAQSGWKYGDCEHQYRRASAADQCLYGSGYVRGYPEFSVPVTQESDVHDGEGKHKYDAEPYAQLLLRPASQSR